jgi:hypothetical protein
MQKALGVTADGVNGPSTDAALKGKGKDVVVQIQTELAEYGYYTARSTAITDRTRRPPSPSCRRIWASPPTASLARGQWTRPRSGRGRNAHADIPTVHDPDYHGYHDADDHRGHDLARDHNASGLGTAELRLDCAVDVAVNVVGPDEVDDSVGLEHGAYRWLQPGEA